MVTIFMTKKELITITVTLAALVAGVWFIIYWKRMKSKGVNPVTGRISSKFGKRTAPTAGASTTHNGVDIAVPIGTSIVSPWDGTVQNVWTDTTYGGGLSLAIMHTNKYRTGYCHLSSCSVAKGEKVKQGQEVAKSGNSGNTTGPHLHFTLTNSQGVKEDPETMFDFKA